MIDGVITKIETVAEGPQPLDSRWGRPLLVEGTTTFGPFYFGISKEAAEEFVQMLAKHLAGG
jgi:hypothetical protein